MRRQLYNLVDNKSQQIYGVAYAALMFVAIMASITPLMFRKEYAYFDYLEIFGCSIFIFDYIAKNASILTWEDQDALNRVFVGDCLALPFKYNVQEYMFCRGEEGIYWGDMDQLQEARFEPVIVHTCGVKPWGYMCNHPYTNEWFKLLEKTPWRGFVATPPPLKRRFIDAAKLYLSQRINFKTGVIDFHSKFEK